MIAVTSPFQGDGKTSLAFALAWSFAGSGYRTVLVDADFVGQALSAQVGRRNQPGFRELLKAPKLNGEVKPMLAGSPLNVIGVGCNDAMGAEGVTRENVSRLFDVLKEQFDVAIIDTGPLLGSVESLPIVSAADGVLLTLRRGRPKRRLDECVRELNVVGGKLLGVVLNCADQAECRRYASASHTSQRSMSREPADSDAGAKAGQPSATMVRLLGSQASTGMAHAADRGAEDQE